MAKLSCPRPPTWLFLLPLLVVACSADADEPPHRAVMHDEEGDALTEPVESFFALHVCAEPPCETFTVSRVNRSSLRCLDGIDRATCAVQSLDVAPARLSEAQHEELLAALTPATQPSRVVVRASLSGPPEAPTLRISEAHLAPLEPSTAALHLLRARASRCDDAPCARLQAQKLNVGFAREVQALSLPLLELSARDELFLQAQLFSPSGLLVAGEVQSTDHDRRFIADAVFKAMTPEAPRCGEELRLALAQASAPLLWPSEGDAPLEAFVLDAAEGSEEAQLRATFALQDETLETEERTIAQLFATLEALQPEQSAKERLEAGQFLKLHALLERELGPLRAIVIGDYDKQLFLIGKSHCAELAGVRTTLTET